MAEYRKTLDFTAISINKNFLERIEKFYEKEKKLIGGNLNLGIFIDCGDGESAEYGNFREFEDDIIPEKIRSIEIRMDHSDYKGDKSFHFIFTMGKEFMDKVTIRASNKSVESRVEKEIESIIKDFRPMYFWLYRFKKFPLIVINILFSGLFSMAIYQIFKGSISKDLVIGIIYVSLILFYSITNKIITSIFPKVFLNIREKISDYRKLIKVVLGVIALGLVVNAIWYLFGGILNVK